MSSGFLRLCCSRPSQLLQHSIVDTLVMGTLKQFSNHVNTAPDSGISFEPKTKRGWNVFFLVRQFWVGPKKSKLQIWCLFFTCRRNCKDLLPTAYPFIQKWACCDLTCLIAFSVSGIIPYEEIQPMFHDSKRHDRKYQGCHETMPFNGHGSKTRHTGTAIPQIAIFGLVNHWVTFVTVWWIYVHAPEFIAAVSRLKRTVPF